MYKITIYLSMLVLFACTSSTPDNQAREYKTGVVLDSAVEGLDYTCANHKTGITTKEGRFSCQQLPVQFFIGALAVSNKLNTLAKDGNVFLGDLLEVGRRNTEDNTVLNLAVLLQSLDNDNNPENGIHLTEEVKSHFSINQHITQLKRPEIHTLLANLGKPIVTVNEARLHLESTLILKGEVLLTQKPLPQTVTHKTSNSHHALAPTLTRQEAIRFLNQTTFGHNNADINNLITIGLTAWMEQQLELASPYELPLVDQDSHINTLIRVARAQAPSHNPKSFAYYTDPNHNFNHNAQFNMKGYRADAWAERSLFATDPLRQRMAYALSQLLVVSENDAALSERADSLAYYYDILAKHAFGNYRDLLKEIALSPVMGMYLTYQGSQKASGIILPDENFARELMQLFTIGLYKRNMDGSFVLENGEHVPTYTQTDVEEMSKIWTGMELRDNHTRYITKFGYSTKGIGKYGMPMEFRPEYHDTDAKNILGVTVPAEQTIEQDIDSAIDILMANPSMAPFISRHLIQRFVTSNPTPAYINRVANTFNDDGKGVKGNLKEVLKAILLDTEAINGTTGNPQFGKVKEPLLAILQFLKAFDVQKLSNGTQFTLESLTTSLGQEAMKAGSVFNFYSPDYIPKDPNFINHNLKAPELQIQTGFKLSSMNNYIFNLFQRNERTKGIRLKGSLSAFEATLNPSYKHSLTISVEDELSVMRTALKDGKNGFGGLNQKVTRDLAINALIDALEAKILTRKLTAAQQLSIVNYFDYYHPNTEHAAWTIIRKTLRFIIPSHLYMIQD
jgi:uncharacterized protein (DUF1800 family)